jgi:molybdenum cofactor cytidylyltransferase
MPAVSALVLAAGRSSRFDAGAHKLLAPIDGRPLVRWSVDAAVAAGVGPVIVVTGAEASDVERALAGLDVRIVHEPAFGEGLATSLRRGVLALDAATDAVIVGLGDQPFVRPEAYQRVVATWTTTGAAIVVPCYATAGGPSHPVLFAAGVFEELRALHGDVGARAVIARAPDRVASAMMEWEAPADVDTREDLLRLTASRPRL